MSDRKSATKRASETATPLAGEPPIPTTVGIRDLRDHLSQYLDLVRDGTSISVTDHGHVIAAIVPMRFSRHTLDLAASGDVRLPRLPKGDARTWPRIPIDGGTDDLIDWAKGEQLP